MSEKGYGSRDSVQAPLTLITAFGRRASSSTFGRSAQGCGAHHSACRRLAQDQPADKAMPHGIVLKLA